jgi:Fe-S oxidoreductase
MGARQANKLINSCSLCGLCERVCPEDFAMQDLCLTARRGMVERDKMPPSAHEFALMDMAFSQGEDFAMARHQPGKGPGKHLFFPGCQLCASTPDKVFRTYQYLCSNLSDGVGLMLGCCSAPAYWAGREEQFENDLQSWKKKWVDLGRPEVILACSTCYRVFSDHLPDVPVISLWQVFENTGLPAPPAPAEEHRLAIHDPCTTRYEPDIQHTVRSLLYKSGIIIEELSLSGELTECCGFGGLMQNANPQVARETIQRRAKLSATDYITYCGMCRDNLAAAGKRVLHILDILFADPQNADPAARKRPGWSQRKENRARLKERFKQALWGEKPVEKKEHECILIRISPQVRNILEERRILDEDIKKVILHAQRSGQTFFNEKTGRYRASFKPYNVTFWIEYSQNENAFDIHNAYSHRMEVVRS